MGFVFIGKNVKYKKKDTRKRVFLFGAPSGIRTPDTLLKSYRPIANKQYCAALCGIKRGCVDILT